MSLCNRPSCDPLHTASASARAFTRTRLRNFNHNINKLTDILCGNSPDHLKISPITVPLILTRWRPKIEAFEAIHFSGFCSLAMNHRLEEFPEVFDNQQVLEDTSSSVDCLTPLFWSAGVVVHPSFASKTKRFINEMNLQGNVHLWPLSFFFWSEASLVRNMKHYELFSRGQLYAGIQLNVFKKPFDGLCMTSFEMFNPHVCSFQQLPWMVNLSGIPIWSQSGGGKENIGGFDITNTHNPAVKQKKSVLLVSYCAPTALTGSLVLKMMFSHVVRFFWPVQHFNEMVYVLPMTSHRESLTSSISRVIKEEQLRAWKKAGVIWEGKKVSDISCMPSLPLLGIRSHVWCVARKEHCYAAVLCTKSYRIDTAFASDAVLESVQGATSVIPRLVTEAKYHSWVVVVGCAGEYATVQRFIDDHLMHIKIEEKDEQREYSISVSDDAEHVRLQYSHSK